MDNEQIYHHGVLGMKWGVRRYQNKDGSLTDAGKKRLQQLDDEREKLTGGKEKASSSSSSKPVKKSISEMSDEELRAKLNRLQMEKQYADLVRNLTPEKENKASSFIKKYIGPATKRILWDTSVDIGAQAVKQMMANSINKNSNTLNINAGQKKDEKKK